ncbi:MAG TPA: VOC family protein [Solirubrobacteraceae bacterium]|nr:VOC family protein [Solirubrobacteraceae bacterium]
MKLEGIHHITAITADAQQNVDFYAGVLGLRLVKKSVNQDQTSVYHLFYADETGDPGSDITFFEYPGLPKGRPGAGMINRIVWRLQGSDALAFWGDRLNHHGIDPTVTEESVVFDDPEGLTHELRPVETTDEPLIANHPEIPAEFAIQGFHAVRAYTIDPRASEPLLQTTLGFKPVPHGPRQIGAHEVRGDKRGNFYLYDPAPDEPPVQGAGSVHHIAFAAQPDEIEQWQHLVREAGAHATQVIDRHYFKSVYFREPSGVLFEIATIGPGFTVDEPLESLGEELSLTPQFERLRDQIEPTLTPLHNPRDDWAPGA